VQASRSKFTEAIRRRGARAALTCCRTDHRVLIRQTRFAVVFEVGSGSAGGRQIAYLTVVECSIELRTEANGFGTYTRTASAARLTNRLAKDAFNLRVVVARCAPTTSTAESPHETICT